MLALGGGHTSNDTKLQVTQLVCRKTCMRGRDLDEITSGTIRPR